MKQRFGFVSNSSSSSFMIVVKNGAISKEKLINAMGVERKSIIYPLAEKVAEFLAEADEVTMQEYINNGYDPVPEIIKSAHEHGYKMYRIYANSDGGEIEVMLHNHGMHYEDENIIIESEDE